MPSRTSSDGSMPSQTEAHMTLHVLLARSMSCHDCSLWRCATQKVFGEGPARTKIMLVGEQPGDREDLEGRPFVGPVRALLDRALAEAAIDRAQVYVTNAVKHFKYCSRGKRRRGWRGRAGGRYGRSV
jgi:uracil-DNA glycosylase